MKKSPGKNLYIVLVVVLLLTNACYSEYVTMRFDSHHGACWDRDSTKVAVVISSQAWRAPEGIARFPDGGQVKRVLRKVAMYIFDPGQMEIQKVADFTDLAEVIGSNRSSWDSNIAFNDSRIYYHVNPVHDWDFLLGMGRRTEEDSIRFREVQAKYSNYFAYDMENGETIRLEPEEYHDASKFFQRTNLTWLNEQLRELPKADIGLRIRDVQQNYSRHDGHFIEETIYMENGSVLTRQAVFEQIIAHLEKEQIQDLLDKMARHKNRLKEPESERYWRRAEGLYRKMEELL